MISSILCLTIFVAHYRAELIILGRLIRCNCSSMIRESIGGSLYMKLFKRLAPLLTFNNNNNQKQERQRCVKFGHLHIREYETIELDEKCKNHDSPKRTMSWEIVRTLSVPMRKKSFKLRSMEVFKSPPVRVTPPPFYHHKEHGQNLHNALNHSTRKAAFRIPGFRRH